MTWGNGRTTEEKRNWKEFEMAKVSEKYLALIRTFPLRPIRSDAELHRAITVIDGLVDRSADDLSSDEAAYLEVLSDLIEKYEDKEHAIGESTPAQMLAFLVAERNVKQKDLAVATGIPVSTVSELLSEKRSFTMNHIERLSVYFKVNPSVFVALKTSELAAV
jgi:HTH-type transcriptional regulator/antitoxin HigA